MTGAPEPLKNCRPAITAHTFDPPPPSLFEKPNWQIYEENNSRTTVCIEVSIRIKKKSFFSNRFPMMQLYPGNIQFLLVVVECVILVLNDIHQ